MKHIFFCHPSMNKLADRIMAINQHETTKVTPERTAMRDYLKANPLLAKLFTTIPGEIPVITRGRIDWKSFPDGWPNLFIADAEDVKDADVSVLVNFADKTLVFEQYSALLALAQLGPARLRILMPYFSTGTMERMDTEGQVATALTLARLICSLRVSGVRIELTIYDIHALGIRHYDGFGKDVIIRFKTGIKLLKEKLAEMEDVAIAFPDAGAYKRFKTFFMGEDGKTPLYPFIICDKERRGNERIVVIREGDPRGKHVAVIDDLAHTCGTLYECDLVLQEAGAASVSNYCTHGVCELDSWEKFLNPRLGLAHFWITDSCPETAIKVEGKDPFGVLSLDRSLHNAITAGTVENDPEYRWLLQE